MKNIFESIIENEINFRQLLIDEVAKIAPNNNIDFSEEEEDDYQTEQFLNKDDKHIAITSFVNYQYFRVEYWKRGVWYAEGEIKTILELVQSIDRWMNTDIKASELANQFNEISLNHYALAYEEDKEVEYTWNWLLKNASENLLAFIEVASKDDVVSLLYPYQYIINSGVKTVRLCFSRCTGYPHTMDTPFIMFSVNSQEYEVYSPNNILLASGDVNKALEILKENLPPNIKPACKGTALDITN